MIERWEGERFCLWSTPESVATGKISLLAILEVLLSVAVYFAIASYFEAYWPLWIALAAVPMLLMRSPESVRWAERYWMPEVEDEIPLKSAKGVAFVAMVFVLSAGLTFAWASVWLADQSGWALFWRAAIIGGVVWPFGIGIAVAVAVAGAGAGAGAGAVAGAVAVAVAGAGAVAVAVAVLFVPGFLAGILAYSICLRFVAVILHLPSGLTSLSQNWMRVMLSEDLAHEPQMVPGVKRSGISNQSLFPGSDLFDKFGRILFPLAYIPALLYRYTLKATFWFYWPLVFISTQGRLGEPGWRADWCRKEFDAKEWFGLISAGVVIVLSIGLVSWPDALDYFGHAMADNVPLTSLTWLFLLDISQLRDQPWRWFSLSNAMLTIILYVWLSQIRTYQRINPERYAMTGWPVGFLVFLARLSLVLFLLYWLVAVWHIMDDRLIHGALGPAAPYVEWVMNFIRRITPI